jgi:hypothetical protein
MEMRIITLILLIVTVITGSSLYTLSKDQTVDEPIPSSSKVANSTQVVSPSSIHWEHQKISNNKK